MTKEIEATSVVELAPYTVELTRGQRGGFGWTIKVRGKYMKKVLNDLDFLDVSLKAKYPNTTAKEEPAPFQEEAIKHSGKHRQKGG